MTQADEQSAAVSAREEAWQRLGRERFDVLIIGGGINGAACARDAALRGLSVAMVEARDFAFGTSSRSSKLIHGGVRYLEYYEFGLVLEACRERDLLRTTIAPHLVRAQPFVFPVFEGDPVPLWQLRAGLMLYDALALFRNVASHRRISRRRMPSVEPRLRSDGLRGGLFYYDCWTDDARLTLETALHARQEGACILNHCPVASLWRGPDGALSGAVVTDSLSGRTATVEAASVINVAGPWLDQIREMDDPNAQPLIRPTKGVHVILDRARVGNENAVVIRGRDGRVMFAIPWQHQTLVGTTDTDYSGDPADVSVEPADVDYVLDAVNRYFPACDARPRDVIAGYAGLRPLVAAQPGASESEVSREDQIFESTSGMLSLGGGKLTTHRRVAERLLERVIARRGGGPQSRTGNVPLPGAAGASPGEVATVLPDSVPDHLRARYGGRAGDFLRQAATAGDGSGADAGPSVGLDGEASEDTLQQGSGGERLVGDLPEIRAEVRHAVEREMACTVEDVLQRRLQVGLRSRERGGPVVEQVAAELAELLGWDGERRQREVQSYREQLRRDSAET